MSAQIVILWKVDPITVCYHQKEKSFGNIDLLKGLGMILLFYPNFEI